MMKCESCGNELTGGAIICRVCNYNNALSSDWRSQRSGQAPAPRRPGDTQSNQSRTTSPLTELPRIVPRKDADANLIRFPHATNKQEGRQTEALRPAPKPQTAMETDAAGSAYPPWRAELKERVRQIRERRNTGELVAAPSPPDELKEVDLDRNPIVESALNRIRWSSHAPAITATASANRQTARATAALPQPETAPEPAPKPETRPQPRPEPRTQARVEPVAAAPKPIPAGQPVINRVETKTLTPKTNREADARPDPKPSPAPGAKILMPRAKSPAATEPKVETRYERRGHETAPRPAAGQPLTSKPPANKPSTNKPLSGAPDKHVETQVIEIAQAPEPPPLPEPEPASLWVRTLAGACDFEIIATAYLPIFGSYAVLNDSFGVESFLIMLMLLSAIAFIYQTVTLTLAGRTFGMALLNLNLVNTDDESMPVTRRQRTLRAGVATFAFLFLPLNYLFTRLNLSHRSLPDLISGTTVAEP